MKIALKAHDINHWFYDSEAPNPECVISICSAGLIALKLIPDNKARTLKCTVRLKQPKQKGFKKIKLISNSHLYSCGEITNYYINAYHLTSRSSVAIAKLLKVPIKRDLTLWVKVTHEQKDCS